MNIEKELAEAEAIRASFEDLIAHGQMQDADRIIVSLYILRQLQTRIERLHEDLHEAAVAHANDESRKRSVISAGF